MEGDHECILSQLGREDMVSYPHVFAGVQAYAHPVDPDRDHRGDAALLLSWLDRGLDGPRTEHTDADGHLDVHSDRNFHRHIDPDPDAHVHAHHNTDGDADSHLNLDPDSHFHSDRHPNANADADTHLHPDRDAKLYPNPADEHALPAPNGYTDRYPRPANAVNQS